MRVAFAGLAALFLSICVLFGAWGPVFWQLALPLWAELAVAAAVGLAAGALAPRRELPAWLAWPILVVLAWAGYAWAAFEVIPDALVPRFLIYPLAASVGVAAGLLAWRMPLRSGAWRLAPIAIGAAAIAGIFFLREPLTAWGQPAPRAAPSYALQLLKGGQVSSEALAGKTVVLSFWATWCAPCRKELPALQKLYAARYAGRDKLRFFVVDEDSGKDPRKRARAWLARRNIGIPAAFDPGGKLMRNISGSGVLPTRVVIGPRGLIRLLDYGYDSADAGFPTLRRAISASRSK